MLDDSADTISNPSTTRLSLSLSHFCVPSPLRTSVFLVPSFLFVPWPLFSRSPFLRLSIRPYPCHTTNPVSRVMAYLLVRSILRTTGLIGNRERDGEHVRQISRLILIGPLCWCKRLRANIARTGREGEWGRGLGGFSGWNPRQRIAFGCITISACLFNSLPFRAPPQSEGKLFLLPEPVSIHFFRFNLSSPVT